jgi:hypothetical protein
VSNRIGWIPTSRGGMRSWTITLVANLEARVRFARSVLSATEPLQRVAAECPFRTDSAIGSADGKNVDMRHHGKSSMRFSSTLNTRAQVKRDKIKIDRCSLVRRRCRHLLWIDTGTHGLISIAVKVLRQIAKTSQKLSGGSSLQTPDADSERFLQTGFSPSAG